MRLRRTPRNCMLVDPTRSYQAPLEYRRCQHLTAGPGIEVPGHPARLNRVQRRLVGNLGVWTVEFVKIKTANDLDVIGSLSMQHCV